MTERTGAAARKRPARPATAPPRHVRGLTLNERLVRERDRDRARELVRTLGLGIVVLLPLLLYVWQQVAFMETAYRVEELRSERAGLERLLRSVRLERASLESLQRVESLARGKLGMRQPPPEAVAMVAPRTAGNPPDPAAGSR